MYQSGKNSLFILKYVTTKIQLSVFFSMYQSRYNYLCIHKYVSIQIQLSLYSWVCINPDTTRSQTLYSLPRTNSDCNQTEFIFIYLYFGFNVIDWLVLFLSFRSCSILFCSVLCLVEEQYSCSVPFLAFLVEERLHPSGSVLDQERFHPPFCS